MTSNKVSSLGLLRLAGQTMNQSKPFWTKGRVVAVVLALCSMGTAYLFSQSKWKIKQEVQDQVVVSNVRSGTDEVKEQTRATNRPLTKADIQAHSRNVIKRIGTGLEYDLCIGVFKLGDKVESVIQKYPTLYHDESGRWIILYTTECEIFSTTKIIAKDGRLKSAYHWSCNIPEIYFFNEKLSPEEDSDLNQACSLMYKKREKIKMTQNTLIVALTGVAANIEFPRNKTNNFAFHFPDLIDSPKK